MVSGVGCHGNVVEMIHRLCTSVGIHFQPMMIRAEVFKVGVSHYFNPARPQKELGYYPIVDMKVGVQRMIDQWVEDEKQWRKEHSRRNFSFVWIVLVMCVAITWYFNR